MTHNLLVDIGLCIGFIWGFTFVLGVYANRANRKRRADASYGEMAIIAAIGSLLMLAFPALFLLLSRWL